MNDLLGALRELLSESPGATARDVARILRSRGRIGLTKSDVNSVLYGSPALFCKSGDSPPRWCVTTETPAHSLTARLTSAERELLVGYNVPCLYSLQHVDNLNSIQRHGILSRNRVQSMALKVVDLSDRSVQRGRKNLEVSGRALHDYVPLFFRALTPMQYIVCIRQGKRNEAAMLEVDVEVFALPGAVFTDGNARANEARFYEDLDALDKLDWGILDTPDAWSTEYRRKKSAEVLVPDVVPPNYIRRVCVTDACTLPKGLTLPCVRDESVFP